MRFPLPTVATTALILALAGCGGSADKAGPDPFANLTAAQAMEKSEAAASAASSFQLGVGAAVTATSDGVSGAVRDALAGNITIDGAGPVTGNDLSFDFEASLGGLPGFQGNVTIADGRAFVGVLGTDYRVEVPESRVRSVRPASLPDGMLDWVADPAIARRDTVDGVEHLVITGTLNLDAAGGDLIDGLAVVQGRSLSPTEAKKSIEQLGQGLTTKTVTLWIAPDTFLPARAEAKLAFDGRIDAFPQISKADLSVDLKFSKYGQNVSISAPNTDEVLDLERLRGLLGG